MGTKFKLDQDYYDTNWKIFEKSSVTFNPGLTILIGCNGSGKSTMLYQIKHSCESMNIPVFYYNNYTQGGQNATSYAGFIGDMERVANDIMSSEGERINNCFADIARIIGTFVRRNLDAEKLFILLDAMDSGYSIDNVIDIKRDLFDLVIDDCNSKGIEVYIIVSANEYELARNEKCPNVSTCEYENINNYDDYRKVIIETRKSKNKRYDWEDYDE